MLKFISKWFTTILIVLCLSLSFNVYAEELSDEEICALCNKAAKEKYRVCTVLVGDNFAPMSEMLSVGECNDMGNCLISEKITNCGGLIFSMDTDGDGEVDLFSMWVPYLDQDTKLVIFLLYGIKAIDQEDSNEQEEQIEPVNPEMTVKK